MPYDFDSEKISEANSSSMNPLVFETSAKIQFFISLYEVTLYVTDMAAHAHESTTA